MKDVVNFLLSVIVLCVLVAVFSVYAPQVESERTGGSWLMASMHSPGSTPGKGEGEGNAPNGSTFTMGQADAQTQGESAQTEPGSAFSLTVTVEKVKDQIAEWQMPTREALLCGVILGVVVTQIVMAFALTAAWLISRRGTI